MIPATESLTDVLTQGHHICTAHVFDHASVNGGIMLECIIFFAPALFSFVGRAGPISFLGQ
jgi:hypothetical protein